MMKKLCICAAVAGAAVGVICLLRKMNVAGDVSTKPTREAHADEPENESEYQIDGQNVVTEMYEAKEKSAQTVYDRHTEASEIMTDAFGNIMQEVEPIEVDEKSIEPIIDKQDVETINELDSLADELDELLK